MISYQMAEEDDPGKRPQLNASLKTDTLKRIKDLAKDFDMKASTVAGEIIELGYEAWAEHKRTYEAWMKKQIRDSVIEPPESAQHLGRGGMGAKKASEERKDRRREKG